VYTKAMPVRGVHLDCRAQMLRFERIGEILEDLARWGFNTILFEYEDRFPYHGRLASLRAMDALSSRQVRSLVKQASDLGLRIIPLVHCLGHLEYVLRWPAFAPLAEDRGNSTVCPSDERSRALFREMVEQVLDLHPDTRWFHMGGDEAVLDSSCPRCRRQLLATGLSGLLVEHYIDRADWLRRQGPDPIIWCDMPLSHPEALDSLRGHVTIMDWDYWSGLQPAPVMQVWGVGAVDPMRLARLPSVHRALFADYLTSKAGVSGARRAASTLAAQPFPYARFLRDHGFPVIVASAARSSGDTFCVPFPRHVENVIGAARTAAREHLLGSLVTSWALRRSPWPLTELSLIAAAMTMKDPAVKRSAIDEQFSREHFGVADPKLARIPLLLGSPVSALLESAPRFDPCDGSWPGADCDWREDQIRSNPARFEQQRTEQQRALRQAARLLERARPRTEHQRERVRLWNWALGVLTHFAGFARSWPTGMDAVTVPRIARWRREARRLQAETRKLLAPIYTARTIRDEQQTRFGVHIDRLDEELVRRGGR
jgi:hypothetical protein